MRWIGAWLRWASATIWTIRASIVSRPTACASSRSAPWLNRISPQSSVEAGRRLASASAERSTSHASRPAQPGSRGGFALFRFISGEVLGVDLPRGLRRIARADHVVLADQRLCLRQVGHDLRIDLGRKPEAAVLVLYTTTFLAIFQHSNLRTPRWLGYVVQRPESHAYHHGRGIHQKNYSDLPIFDLLFGTWVNPKEFIPAAGFYDGASLRIGDLLLGRDVTHDAEKKSTALAET